MTWPEIETYRQLEHEYEHDLGQFRLSESAYREAVSTDLPPASLREIYESLAARRLELEAKRERLRQMRNDLAHKREEVAQEAVFSL